MKEKSELLKAYMNISKRNLEKEAEKKKDKAKLLVLLYEIVVGIIGLCLIGFFSSWWVALGVWLLLISNNILILRNVGEKSKMIKFWEKDE